VGLGVGTEVLVEDRFVEERRVVVVVVSICVGGIWVVVSVVVIGISVSVTSSVGVVEISTSVVVSVGGVSVVMGVGGISVVGVGVGGVWVLVGTTEIMVIMVPSVVVGLSVVAEVSEDSGVVSVGARGYLIMAFWNMLDGVGGERHAGAFEASR